jgi:hypothetical protein
MLEIAPCSKFPAAAAPKMQLLFYMHLNWYERSKKWHISAN